MKLVQLWHAHRARVIILVLLLAGGGYWWYSTANTPAVQVKYVTAAVTRGTLITSVSATGQVASETQVDVKPDASGKVLRVAVQPGQQVRSGDVLAQLDSTNAQKVVRDAAVSLESAQLAMQKLVQPADQLSITQAESAVTQAKQSKQDSEDALVKAYSDGFTDVSNTFLDFPGLMAGLDDLLFNKDFDATQWNVDWYSSQANVWDSGIGKTRDDVVAAYQAVRTKYDANFTVYQATSRTADTATIGALIGQTNTASQTLADAVKAFSNYLNHIQDLMSQHNFTAPQRMMSQQATLNTYTGTVNGHLTTLTNVLNTIKFSTQDIKNADQAITEKTQALAKLMAGADELDIKSQQLALKQRQISLDDARAALADYTVRAPISGVVAKVNVQVGDSASSGSAVATVLATQQVAEVTLNEVDVAKVALKQKVTLTFDAVEGLSLTGTVAEIDTIGTTSQGVVSYTVKVLFDAQDARVKPGMSVSASIITDVRQDVLLAPNAAVKAQGGSSYVQVLVNGAPQRVPVQLGASNDTSTEITSGVTEGTEVVTQTIGASAAGTTTPTSSTQRSGTSIIPGLSGGGAGIRVGGGGAFRGD